MGIGGGRYGLSRAHQPSLYRQPLLRKKKKKTQERKEKELVDGREFKRMEIGETHR
jgi:hypothetical protein